MEASEAGTILTLRFKSTLSLPNHTLHVKAFQMLSPQAALESSPKCPCQRWLVAHSLTSEVIEVHMMMNALDSEQFHSDGHNSIHFTSTSPKFQWSSVSLFSAH